MAGKYRNVAVASTFSPRFHAVLAEAASIADCLTGSFSIVHASESNDEKIERFRGAFEQLSLPSGTQVVWSPALSPVEGILSACERNSVDLLIAGALESENEHRYFLGGVARELMKKAVCDLLLITDPQEVPQDWKKFIVEFDFRHPDKKLISKACSLARRFEVEELLFVSVRTPFDLALASARGEELPHAEDALIESLREDIEFEGELDAEIIESTTGFSVCDFVQERGADLLIVCTRPGDSAGPRELPTCMDWLHQVIPTNLMLIGH